MTTNRTRPVYSLCVSNWNSMNTVQTWADSLFANISSDDEVIIVDNESKDGSGEFLRRICQREGFTFISARTNMGEARQLAFEHSTGKYAVFQLDTDDVIVSLPEVKRLYHEVVEHDPVTGDRRAFRCVGYFIVPSDMLAAVGGYPDLHYYEDLLLAFRLAERDHLTGSWKVSPVVRGTDPKKARMPFRLAYSFRRVRDGLRLGVFYANNIQGYLLYPPAWLASRFSTRYEFGQWWTLDVHRDEFILPWIRENRFAPRLLVEEMESPGPPGAQASPWQSQEPGTAPVDEDLSGLAQGEEP